MLDKYVIIQRGQDYDVYNSGFLDKYLDVNPQ